MESKDMKEYYLLYMLLDTTEQTPLSSAFLSKLLSLSNKSIQNSIAVLKPFCKQKGFVILSKAGAGFYCHVLDPVKTTEFKLQLTIYFSKTHLVFGDSGLEEGKFALFLVDRKQPISINALCDQFYFSKSKIYSYISTIKGMLSQAGLELVNERNRGVWVDGPEFIRRCYMAACLGNSLFYYDLSAMFQYDFHFIPKNPALAPRILQVLHQNGLSLDDEQFNSFLLYLTYSQYRYLRHCLLQEFDEEEISNLAQCPEYSCARQIAQLLSCPYSNDPVELAGIAAFLLCSDARLENVSPDHYGKVHFEGIRDLFQHLNTYLLSLSGSFQNIAEYTPSLWQLSARLYFLYHFDVASHSFANTSYNPNISSNALIRYLSRLLAEQIADYFEEQMSYIPATCVCNFIQNLLYSIPQEKNDIRLLLILKRGVLQNDYISTWLRKHLKPEPLQIDFMSLIESSTANLNYYDLILTDYENLDRVQENYKVYHITDPIDQDTSFVNEYYRISNMRNISLERIVHYFSRILIKWDCSIENTRSFLEIAESDLDGYGDIPFRMVRRRGRPFNYYSGNNILVVPHIFKEGPDNENVLAIYFNDKKKHLKYDVMVFFSAKSSYEVDALVRLMNLCNEFCVHPEVFEKLAGYLSSK